MSSYYQSFGLGWKHASGRYYGFHTSSLSTGANLTNGQTRAAPYFFPEAVRLDRIGVEVTSAGESGSLVRLGIWAPNPSTGMPDALILDAGTVAGDGSTGFKEITISQIVGPGVVWFSDTSQLAPTTRPTLRTVGAITFPQIVTNGNGFQGSSALVAYASSNIVTSGALGASYSPQAVGATAIGRIQFRVV